MKVKRGVFGLTCFIAAFLALVIWAGVFPPVSASAAGAYDYEVTAYELTYTVEQDCTVRVQEKITAYFTGYDSHGMIRDLPLENGVRYENVAASCEDEDFHPHIETESDDWGNYLSVYLRGEGRVTGQTRNYTLQYDMIVSPLQNGRYFPLDVVNFAHANEISNVKITVNFPAGKLSDYVVYSGRSGTNRNECGVFCNNTGSGSLELTVQSLPSDCGVTLDMLFENGVLHKRFNMPALVAAAAACVVVLAAVLVKRFAFKSPLLTCPVNFTAPDEMDPLMMGKLIDNTVDKEDMGSLVFWLASEGYLTIDISESENDPVLRPTGKSFGEGAPSYCKLFFDGLFERSDEVRVSSLKDFYTTAQAVKASVETRVNEDGGVYQNKTALGAVFAILFALLAAGVLCLYSLFRLTSNVWEMRYFYWTPFVFCLLTAAAGYVPAKLIEMWQYKWKKAALVGVAFASLGIGLVLSLFSLLSRGAATGSLPNLFLALGSWAAGFLCGFMAKRTDGYVKKIGNILGFKNFIVTTEHERIKFMLKDNPELYYKILPYAQVLGVTDAWANKFEGLQLEPPAYLTGGVGVFDYLIYRRIFLSFGTSFASKIDPPGKGGGHGGGFGGGGGGHFGGGFGGGGFGGGGMRGC